MLKPTDNPVGAMGFVFRDERLQALFSDRKNARLSRETAFLPARAVIKEIHDAAERGAISTAINGMTQLLTSATPVPDSECEYFLSDIISPLIPSDIYPVISPVAKTAGVSLCSIFERAQQNENTKLTVSSGEKLYRFHEGCGDFEKARAVLGVMLSIERRENNISNIARLTGNYGYEYLLERRMGLAAPYFFDALALFRHLGNRMECDNARANILTCQFATYPASYWNEWLVPELKRLNDVFVGGPAFRARKTLMLLARRDEYIGSLSSAIGWARRAVEATERMQTRHHLEDQIYLSAMRNRQHEDQHRG